MLSFFFFVKMVILNFLALKITKDCGFCNIKKYENMEN